MEAGTRETEVWLDGWCEGGLGHQRNDGGGCASKGERSERVESTGTYVTERVSRGHFLLAHVFFRTALLERGVGCRYMMRLERTVKRAQILNIKEQMSSIWAKGIQVYGLSILITCDDLT